MRMFIDVLGVIYTVPGGESVKLLSFQTLDRKHGPGLTVIRATRALFVYDLCDMLHASSNVNTCEVRRNPFTHLDKRICCNS